MSTKLKFGIMLLNRKLHKILPSIINLKMSKENFEALKITLQHCLPLIRYFHIPDKDNWEKVKPYKKILEKLPCNDLIQHHMSQINLLNHLFCQQESFRILNYISTLEFPFSTIINKEHAAELSSWID